ncbi:hypothetical protein Leryth_016247 [Lithospermum erythrorhizon]|nr:hypothetical protein Leryth_016247 [Lithospermum erythrorhizon]
MAISGDQISYMVFCLLRVYSHHLPSKRLILQYRLLHEMIQVTFCAGFHFACRKYVAEA